MKSWEKMGRGEREKRSRRVRETGRKVDREMEKI
jgi:hypothetical protein